MPVYSQSYFYDFQSRSNLSWAITNNTKSLKIEIVFSITLTRKVIVPNKFGSRFYENVLFITTNITFQS